jgi:hypothetical protein
MSRTSGRARASAGAMRARRMPLQGALEAAGAHEAPWAAG